MTEETQTIPDEFCVHEVQTCVFCSKRVHYGHTGDVETAEMMLLHDAPACDEFKLCSGSLKEFSMLTILKIKSDLGQLERN